MLEARVSVWDPWCGESGFRSGPLSLGSPGFGLGSLVGKDGCRPVALGVEKFGFGPCLWCEKFGCDTWSGNSGIASGAPCCAKPKQIFYLRWQLQSPPRLRSFKLCTTREGRAAMPKKRELPASSDVSGQDMPTTEAPWNHKVMDYIAEVFIWFIPTTGVPLLFYRLPRNARGHRQPRRSLRREHRISSTGKHHALQFGSPQASMF